MLFWIKSICLKIHLHKWAEMRDQSNQLKKFKNVLYYSTSSWKPESTKPRWTWKVLLFYEPTFCDLKLWLAKLPSSIILCHSLYTHSSCWFCDYILFSKWIARLSKDLMCTLWLYDLRLVVNSLMSSFNMIGLTIVKIILSLNYRWLTITLYSYW